MSGRGRKPKAQYRRMARTRRRLAKEDAREVLRVQLKLACEAGASIRDLADAHKLAFATVRTLLLEAGVPLRSRGGPNRRRRDGDQLPPDGRDGPPANHIEGRG